MDAKPPHRSLFDTKRRKICSFWDIYSNIEYKICNDNDMVAISKNVFIGKLGDIVTKYNNIYHRAIKVNIYVKQQGLNGEEIVRTFYKKGLQRT